MYANKTSVRTVTKVGSPCGLFTGVGTDRLDTAVCDRMLNRNRVRALRQIADYSMFGHFDAISDVVNWM